MRNDALTTEQLLAKNPKALIIGPGPGTPSAAGITKEIILQANVPILGICLGHQAIGEVFGARLERAPTIMHGKVSPIYHQNDTIFFELPNPFEATRYHSLIIKNLPDILSVSAWTEEGEVMGVAHRERPLYGVQFHPESICTQHGLRLLKNFLSVI